MPQVELFAIADVHLSGEAVESGFIIDVEDAEQMGSKEKFWCTRHGTGERHLLKYARPHTGEDWAEKIASELAGEAGLGLPHARVELATFRDRSAVLVRDFLADGERLIPGNELLVEHDPEYPRDMRRVSQHTLAKVFDLLEAQSVEIPSGLDLPKEVRTSADLYSGYIVLDALIGNTDRHHENWGVVVKREAGGERVLALAPTYDHGSSLGRELRDEDRRKKLKTSDARSNLHAYADRARSAFFGTVDSSNTLRPLEVLLIAAERCGDAVGAWIDRLDAAKLDLSIQTIIDRVPRERMSNEAREFARILVEYNLSRIREATR